MSKDAVKQMFAKLEKDPALKEKYVSALKTNAAEAEKTLQAKLVEIGKSAGFSFSSDDLLAARAELADNANSNRELDEADLATVAGGDTRGKVKFGISSLYSLGVVCVGYGFNSLAAELDDPGSCAGKLTLSNDCTVKNHNPK